MALACLGAHALVTWYAYQTDGRLAAPLTFLTLGLGEAYWAVLLLTQDGLKGPALAATATAIFYFASMGAKPILNALLAREAAELLDDFASGSGRPDPPRTPVGRPGPFGRGTCSAQR